jgi:hypothetical protein
MAVKAIPDTFDKALAALKSVESDAPVEVKAAVTSRPRRAAKKRGISPEARERMAAAQRKRWAAVRKAAKKAQ